MNGLTKGTRHYIQYQLTDGEDWQDLLFADPVTGSIHGLWCSRSFTAARKHVEELMTVCDTTLDNYRIVKRTWNEEVITLHAPANPNAGLAFNDPNYYDPEYDADPDKITDTDDDDDDYDDDEDDDLEPPVNTPVANPLVK